jgi:hypothetical protein
MYVIYIPTASTVLPLHTSYMHALRPAPTTPCSARHTTRAAVSIGGLHRSED